MNIKTITLLTILVLSILVGFTINIQRVYALGYYVPITISTTLSAPVYNYSLRLNLTALGFTGWANTAPNGSDIYFLDSNGNPLYYWIEDYNATLQEGIIWVNITLTNVTIYMYYGETNPYTTYNNPYRVFLWYDDFNTNTTSLYTPHVLYNGGNGAQELTVNTSTGEAIIGDPGDDGDEVYDFVIPSQPLDNIIVMAKLDKVVALFYSDLSSVPHWQNFRIGLIQDPTVNDNFIVAGYNHPDATGSPLFAVGQKVSGTFTGLYTNNNYIYGYTVGVAKYNTTFYIYLNNNIVCNTTISSFNTLMYPIFYSGTCWNGAEGKSYWDWVLVAKYVDPSNYTISLGTPVSLGGVSFTGTITPSSVNIVFTNASQVETVVFNITISNSGSINSWCIVELIDGRTNTTLFYGNYTLTPGDKTYTLVQYNFTLNDRGNYYWYLVLLNDTTVFQNTTIAISVHLNISYTFHYVLDKNYTQAVFPFGGPGLQYGICWLTELNITDATTGQKLGGSSTNLLVPVCVNRAPLPVTKKNISPWGDLTTTIGLFAAIIIPLAIGLILSRYFGLAGLFIVIPSIIYYSRAGILPGWVGVVVGISLFILLYLRIGSKQVEEGEE